MPPSPWIDVVADLAEQQVVCLAAGEVVVAEAAGALRAFLDVEREWNSSPSAVS